MVPALGSIPSTLQGPNNSGNLASGIDQTFLKGGVIIDDAFPPNLDQSSLYLKPASTPRGLWYDPWALDYSQAQGSPYRWFFELAIAHPAEHRGLYEMIMA